MNKLRRLWCWWFGPCGEVYLVKAESTDPFIQIWCGRVYCKGCGRMIG